jgi:hypothetical protein
MSGVPWSEKELNILKEFGETRLCHEIAEMLPGRTPDSIKIKKSRIGVLCEKSVGFRRCKPKRTQTGYDNMCKLDLTFTLESLDNNTKQILIGTMIGDGTICGLSANERNNKFILGNEKEQFDYTKWKSDNLQIFLPKERIKPSGGLQATTKSHTIFTKYRPLFYKDPKTRRKTNIPLDVMDKIDLFGLLIWYLDDGNYTKKSAAMTISVTKYPMNELINITDILNQKYNLKLNPKQCSHLNGKHLRKDIKIYAEDRRKLFSLWKPIVIEYGIPKCMWYKLDMERV